MTVQTALSCSYIWYVSHLNKLRGFSNMGACQTQIKKSNSACHVSHLYLHLTKVLSCFQTLCRYFVMAQEKCSDLFKQQKRNFGYLESRIYYFQFQGTWRFYKTKRVLLKKNSLKTLSEFFFKSENCRGMYKIIILLFFSFALKSNSDFNQICESLNVFKNMLE